MGENVEGKVWNYFIIYSPHILSNYGTYTCTCMLWEVGSERMIDRTVPLVIIQYMELLRALYVLGR